MKHLLLCLLLLAGLAPVARAQSANPAIWCPPGATWTYGWAWWSERGTLTMRYVRDTVVASQAAQLLTRKLVSYNYIGPVPGPPSTSSMPSIITRVVASRVEVWANGQFYTLYDFAVPVGSSWLTPRVVPYYTCPNEQVLVTVDSVGTRQIGGRSLRWFRAHLTSLAGAPVLGSWPARIYEQLGSLGYLQPQSPLCGGTDPGYMGTFTGFQATGWPSVSYNAGTGTLLGTAQSRAAAAGFTVYPNPGTGLFTLELPVSLAPSATLRLLDLTGRVLRQSPVPASQQLDVRGLPVGSYTLLLLAPGQAPLARRLLLE